MLPPPEEKKAVENVDGSWGAVAEGNGRGKTFFLGLLELEVGDNGLIVAYRSISALWTSLAFFGRCVCRIARVPVSLLLSCPCFVVPRVCLVIFCFFSFGQIVAAAILIRRC